MKTDDLVAMLSTNVEPIGRGLVGRTISIAVAAGAVIALGFMLAALGIRANTVCRNRAIRPNQPGCGAKLALEQDDPWR